jgi:putative ABC transport system permease protein
MRFNFAEVREFLRIATEALGRYKLRTTLSVLGVVLGVAAVIAMLSVSEGAAREALAQVEGLGLDNLVARSKGLSAYPSAWRGLTAADSGRTERLMPLVRTSSPLIDRFQRVAHAEKSVMTHVLGVRPAYQQILRMSVDRGRFLSASDEMATARTCVLGARMAEQLFGYRDPVGQYVAIGREYYQVVGVLGEQGADAKTGGALAWHDINLSAFVPLPTLSGRTLAIAPEQPVDEVWVQVEDGSRAVELGTVFGRVISGVKQGRAFDVVVPRELLAQRQRTQRTFSVVIGSIAAIALLVGGIGIMNIMLTSVVERTREIGVRRTVGATRRDVAFQFLTESVLMTVGGGALGILIGGLVSFVITAFAGWSTRISPESVALGFFVSLSVGLTFGLYPALKAAALEPVDAMRYE